MKPKLKHKKNNFEDRKQEHLHKHSLYLVKVLNKAQRKFMDEVHGNLEFNTTVFNTTVLELLHSHVLSVFPFMLCLYLLFVCVVVHSCDVE